MDCTLSENRKLDRKIAARKKSEMELYRRSDDDDDEDETNLNVLMLLLFLLNRQFSSKNNKHIREAVIEGGLNCVKSIATWMTIYLVSRPHENITVRLHFVNEFLLRECINYTDSLKFDVEHWIQRVTAQWAIVYHAFRRLNMIQPKTQTICIH